MESLKATTSHISPPSKWLSNYSNFIQTHQSSVTQIESALRSLTYIIPGRFRDAELASESLHSSIQLLSMYHDTLLSRSLSKIPGMHQQSTHNRYTKFWMGKSEFYRRVATVLQIVQYTELLWEMSAKRKGERIRWRVVVILELLKAICRILLLRITNSRPLVTPALPEREIIPEQDLPSEEEEMEEELRIEEGNPSSRGKKEYRMKRTGLSLPTLPNPSDISAYLLTKVLTADDIKPPSSLLLPIRGTAFLSETLHILQPLIYALALSRSHSKSNWQPWLLGLSLEYAARQLRNQDLRTTTLEREQWSKRGWNMGWWMMRGAFYENVTKGFLHGASAKLPSLVSGVLDDYLYLWDGYYFSTSSN